jgi:hypothetical protein
MGFSHAHAQGRERPPPWGIESPSAQAKILAWRHAIHQKERMPHCQPTKRNAPCNALETSWSRTSFFISEMLVEAPKVRASRPSSPATADGAIKLFEREQRHDPRLVTDINLTTA